MKKSLKISALILLSVFFLGDASAAHAKTVQATITPYINLAYCWTQGQNDTTCPTNDTIGGWGAGLDSPSVTVTYQAVLTNASTGAVISDGDSVPVGTIVTIAPTPQVSGSGDIDWFGTGKSEDSPYGEWSTSAPPFECDANDYVNSAKVAKSKVGAAIYIPLVIAPPSESILTSSNLSCGVAAANGSKNCTVTSAGITSASVLYPTTSGKFYYRYIDKLVNSGACQANNIPMEIDMGPGMPTNSDPYPDNLVTGSPYILSVPPESILFSFTAVANNQPPVTPTISCPASVVQNTSFNISASATDPNGDQIKYGIDWQNSGSVSAYAPASGLVNSGTSQTATLTGGFSSLGSHTINVNATDSKGASSSFASCAVTVIAPPPPVPTALLTATPSTISAGSSSSLQYTCTNGTSASINNGVGAVSPATGGSVSVAPSSSTNYTLTCTNSTGSATNSAAVTVVPLPDITATSGGNVTIPLNSVGTLSSYIYNANGPTNQPFYDTFWIDNDQNLSNGYISYQEYQSGVPNGFPANYGETDSVNYTPTTPGTYYYLVCADLNQSWAGSITESNENNNCSAWATITVTAPNLTAGAVTPTTAIQGTPITLSAPITNSGVGSTGIGFTDLFQEANDSSGTGSTDIGTYANGPLGQGSSNTASLAYTFPSAGTSYVRACADKSSAGDTGVIGETNENDNCGAWTSVSVLPPLSASCSASPAGILPAPANVVWTASASGGSGSYTYSWGGNVSGTTASVPETYPAGSYNGIVNVTDSLGDHTAVSCSNDPVTVINCTPALASNPASPPGIVLGQTDTLTWNENTSCASSCVFSDGHTAGLSGSYVVTPPDPSPGTVDHYSVMCGVLANTASTDITVTVPKVTLTASPARVVSGGTTALTWTSTDTNTCTITRNGTGATVGTGLQGTNVPDTTPITEQTVYTARCTTAGSDVTARAVVNIVPKFLEF